MQRMNPPRGMGPMGPGPQVTSAAPKSLAQLCQHQPPSPRPPGAGRAGRFPPSIPPLVLMHFTLVLPLEIPPFNVSEVFRAARPH